MPRYHYLTPVLGGPGAPRYPVVRRKQVIGRSEQADVALLEPTVSRRHATVEVMDDEVWLEDLGSKHGTFVNSRRISRARLRVGDIVVFGLSIVLRLEETDSEVPRALPLRVPGVLSNPLGPPGTAEVLDESTRAVRQSIRSETALYWTVDQPRGYHDELEAARIKLLRALRVAGPGAYCARLMPRVLERVEELRERAEGGEGEGGAEGDAAWGPEAATLLKQVHGGVRRLCEVLERCACPTLGPVSLRECVKRAHGRAAAREDPDARGDPELDVDAGLLVEADEARLTRALGKVITCLVRHAYPDAPLRVQATPSLAGVTMVLAVRGDGLDPALPDALWGLAEPKDPRPLFPWLPILEARQIVMSMAGDLELEARDDGQVEVTIELPASPR